MCLSVKTSVKTSCDMVQRAKNFNKDALTLESNQTFDYHKIEYKF